MLFSGDAGHRLEPVGIVSCPFSMAHSFIASAILFATSRDS
jgi:hypothetical protein